MIIFIYGENQHSAAQHLGAMRDRFQEKFDASGMNLATFSGKLEIGPIAQAIQTPGFMSEKRMVVVHGLLEQVTRKPDAKPWVEFLEKTPEETILILFESQSDKKVTKNEIYKQLSKQETFHAYPFPILVGASLEKWAKDESSRIGLHISDTFLRQVTGLVGSDLWQLSGELAKLKAFAQSEAVTDEMIALFVKANFQDAMFDFVDAVSQKNTKLALKLLEEQRQSGSTDFHLFAMLARQVRLLIGARDVLERNPGATKQDVGSELGVHPFVAQKMLSQARSFNVDQLQHIHDLLFQFDKKVKTGDADMETAVDRIVVEMIS